MPKITLKRYPTLVLPVLKVCSENPSISIFPKFTGNLMSHFANDSLGNTSFKKPWYFVDKIKSIVTLGNNPWRCKDGTIPSFRAHSVDKNPGKPPVLSQVFSVKNTFFIFPI